MSDGMLQRLDRGTRNYALFLLAVVVLWIGWALYEDPQMSALNQRLEDDPVVSVYPYRFRVLRVGNGVATMSTPRSSAVPVARILGILYPNVAGKPETSDAYMHAQQQLAKTQTRARDTVLDDPQIKSINWELDRTWLTQHGIQLTPGY